MSKIDGKVILQRLKLACNFKMDKEVAEALNLAQASISTWYKREYADLNLIAEHLPDVSLDYLVTGEGPRERDLRKAGLAIENKENDGVKMLAEILQEQLKQKDDMLFDLNQKLIEKEKQLQEAHEKMLAMTVQTTELIGKLGK